MATSKAASEATDNTPLRIVNRSRRDYVFEEYEPGSDAVEGKRRAPRKVRRSHVLPGRDPWADNDRVVTAPRWVTETELFLTHSSAVGDRPAALEILGAA